MCDFARPCREIAAGSLLKIFIKMKSNDVKCREAMRRKTLPIRELEKVWLTSAEVKAWLDCSDEFLAKLREEAKIAYAQIGGKFYHESASILLMFEKYKVPAALN